MELNWKLAVKLAKSICSAVNIWLIYCALRYSMAHTCIPVMW